MEERIIDKDELRGVKKKRTDGEEDVVDINTTDADLPEEAEYSVEFDGEYDEDLVGLTPTQLKEELERRERLREEAHAEAVKYLAAGEEAFEKGDFARAERDFRDALSYEFSEQTQERLFAAVTDNYTNAQRLLLLRKPRHRRLRHLPQRVPLLLRQQGPREGRRELSGARPGSSAAHRQPAPGGHGGPRRAEKPARQGRPADARVVSAPAAPFAPLMGPLVRRGRVAGALHRTKVPRAGGICGRAALLC